ncbi:hypothetical protein Srufu_047070 [Streptomyces libani subsp. rufus]|nr:hypothetical protein Srufu_047070 [Streptomyces libani subsp. rufus]
MAQATASANDLCRGRFLLRCPSRLSEPPAPGPAPDPGPAPRPRGAGPAAVPPRERAAPGPRLTHCRPGRRSAAATGRTGQPVRVSFRVGESEDPHGNGRSNGWGRPRTDSGREQRHGAAAPDRRAGRRRDHDHRRTTPAPPGRLRHTADRLRTRTAPLRTPRLDPYWTAAFFFLAFALVSLFRFRTMSISSWDLGIFEQAVRGYAHFQAPIVDLKGPGTNILGDHFSPILIVLAPFYRVFPSPVTLLTAQAALFALSVLPVTRAAARHLGRLPGLAVGIAYGMSWGVQKAVDFDFHEIAFALPLIAFALEAVLRGRWTAAVCWAAPLVLVKEDLGVTAATIGALALIRTRRASPLAIGLVAFGITATAVTLGLLIPGFNGSGSYDYWTKFGAEGGGATIPLDDAVRTTLWVLLPTTGLLALRSPLLLVALPTLGWRFLSHEPHYWGTDWHYNAVLMPVVFLALIDALPAYGSRPAPGSARTPTICRPPSWPRPSR